jgi:hypothetical protein
MVPKAVPLYKNKESVNCIKKYKPIAKVCTTTKIFAKLILKRIMEI